jgi:hypothetical protein
MGKSRSVMARPDPTPAATPDPASGPTRERSTDPADARAALAGRWLALVLWVSLPLAAGPAFADALDPRSRPVQLVASIGLWITWAAVVGAALVPRSSTLTAIRIVMPASFAAALWAAIATPTVGVDDVVALTVTLLAAIAALAAFTGAVFVNGSAYGDERRLPLRPPLALLLGPVELAWLVCVAGATAGPLLLAAESWIAGAVVLAIGWPAAWFAARALNGLAQRWVVFVPAGFVVHDLMALTDPLLLPRRLVTALGPALADTRSADFTLGSAGLALQVDLAEPVEVTPVPRRTSPGQRPEPQPARVDSLLFAPSRPGAVLREARRRRLPVG